MKKLEELIKALSDLSKKVREPDVSSEHTDSSINPALGGKYGKIHGGDPRKAKDFKDTVLDPSNKPKLRVSGASNLRNEPGVKVNEVGHELEKDEVIKTDKKTGQWSLEKAVPGIKSSPVFSMDHIKGVSEAPSHEHAKSMAHDAIKTSTAHPHNKAKASLMVNGSKDSKHLAQGMTNFYMAHDAKIRSRLNGNRD